MARRPLAVASLLILALAACGGPSDEDVLTDEKIRASQSAPELPDVQLSENPEPPPAPPPVVQPPVLNELDNMVEENLVDAGVPGTIPPAFQGRWGVVQLDCRQGEVVGTGMLVFEDGIGFADFVGRLQSVLADLPGRFAGVFEYDDGGLERVELAFGASRNVLTRAVGGERIIYRRCGAGRPTG